MGYTDNCDLFASFHEDGFNRIIYHVKRQRPSLFNYATQDIASNNKLLCKAIELHPIVDLRNNPPITIVDPLPIPGTNYGVNFAVQLVDFKIDFHPGDEFNLPSQLNPPLADQHLAIKITLCGGIGCPPDEVIDQFIPIPEERDTNRERKEESQREKIPPRPIPTRRLHCFCLDAFLTGGFRIVKYSGNTYLEPFMDGFEIVDIEPAELENSIECYISLILKLVVLPGLRILLPRVPLNLTQGATDLFPQPTNIVLSPMPVSSSLANNPAIEENELKTFIKAEVI